MIYGKWKLDFTNDANAGAGCDPIVVGRGDLITGAFIEGDGDPHNFIYGYLNDDFDFDGLEAWQITEVTQAEILEKAREQDPECYIDDNGAIVWTKIDDN